jgi:hypothetical protein
LFWSNSTIQPTAQTNQIPYQSFTPNGTETATEKKDKLVTQQTLEAVVRGCWQCSRRLIANNKSNQDVFYGACTLSAAAAALTRIIRPVWFMSRPPRRAGDRVEGWN